MMLKYMLVTGLQYDGESLEDMERRERAMKEHNDRVDELYAEWERQRSLPMPSMREWAKARGLIA